MKRHRQYRITLSDESRLQNFYSRVYGPFRLAGVIILTSLTLMAIGGAIALLTPLRHLTPGYMGREQRAASEIAYLRIDSLKRVIDANSRYLDNIKMALDTERVPTPVDTTTQNIYNLPADSLLLMATEAEERLVSTVRRSGLFNRAVQAPTDAEGMIFHFPATSGYFSQHPLDNMIARLTLPKDASVCAIADGMVVGVSRSTRERGYLVWIQHDNGFLSRYSRLGIPLVDQGRRVEGGEAIATTATNTGMASEFVDLMLWHNGEPLNPRIYLPSN